MPSTLKSKPGIWGTTFAVEVDHAKHPTPIKAGLNYTSAPTSAKPVVLMTAAQLRSGRELGTLSALAIREIAAGLLAREAVRAFLPKKAVPALKSLL